MLLPLAHSDTGVRFIDDYGLWARASETFAALVCFDVIQADDGKGMCLKNGLRCCQAAFKACRRRCGYRHSIQVELGAEFHSPLLDKLWWTENGETIYLAPINQLPQDQRSLDSLTDTDVIGDHQTNCWQTERHQEWDELVGARFKGKASGGAEGARSSSKR